MLTYINNLSLVIAFLAGLTIYFRRAGVRYLKLFPVFLFVISAAQWTGYFLSEHNIHNTILYNLVIITEFVFYFYTMSLAVQHKKAKRIIGVLPYVFAGLALLNMFFLQGVDEWNSMTYAFGSLLTVAVCIYYFFELFQVPQATNVAKTPIFWICSGLLFFYACTFPLLGLVNFLKNAPAVILHNFKSILDLLNILLYCSFTIAFLCRIKVRNSMS